MEAVHRVALVILLVAQLGSSHRSVRLITFSTGSGNPIMGYEIITAAVDVALARASTEFPAVVGNLSRTNFFVKGDFLCADAEMHTIAGMHVLLGDTKTRQDDDEIRIVITPGCSFEVIDLGDFARGGYNEDNRDSSKRGQIHIFGFFPEAVTKETDQVLLGSIVNPYRGRRNRAMNAGMFSLHPSLQRVVGKVETTLQPGPIAYQADVVVMASTASVAFLKDKGRFPTTLAMAAGPYSDAAQAVIRFILRNKWTKVNLLCYKMDPNSTHSAFNTDPNSTHSAFNTGSEVLCGIMIKTLQSMRGTINIVVRRCNPDSVANIRDVLRNSKAFSTVTVLVSQSPHFLDILDVADTQDMATGEYVFLVLSVNGLPELDQAEIIARPHLPNTLAFTFVQTFGDINWNNINKDMTAVYNRSATEYGYTAPPDLDPPITLLSAYECAFMVVQMLNETWDILDRLSGKDLASRFFGRTFELPSRSVSVTNEGARVADVLFKQYHQSRKSFKNVFIYLSLARKILPYGNVSVMWNKLLFPPADIPICGFEHERCQSAGGRLFYLFFLALVPVTAVLVVIQSLRARSSFPWHLSETDILCEHAQVNLSKMSVVWLAPQKQLAVPLLGDIQWFYRGQLATMHEIHSGLTFRVAINHKQTVALLDTVTKLEHPNLSRLFGFLWVPPDPHCVSPSHRIRMFCDRGNKGSLDQLLRHQDRFIGWELRFALIADILQGLIYVRNTGLRYHDALSTKCITVTKQFGALIEDAAFDRMRLALKGSVNADILAGDMWKSQEQKLEGVTAANGVSGNIYSLGVILYQIATRKLPLPWKNFGEDHVAELKSVSVDNTKDASTKDIPPELVYVIQKCWSVEPAVRPTLQDIRRSLSPHLPSQQTSLMDRLSERLTHYNQELETIVRERNKNLLEEMHRVDDLLSELLPRDVIPRLRKSEVIEPEYFGSVSILFSGIPVFDDFVKENSPLTVVFVLHDLHSTVDKLLPKYDVYKVESIKDTYMIASGLPVASGSNHALVLAELAIEMMACTQQLCDKYGTRGSPPLQMRIGIHSGPCVGGVIGIKLPHYTLFGDTVNTASRMETTGLASRIQISSSTRAMVLFRDSLVVKSRGFIDVKGKGNVETFWLSVQDDDEDL